MNEFSRYTGQLNLPDFGMAAQAKLKAASVLIVGMGGLGCPAAMYLAASGVGRLGLVDFDVVSASNLHRQILYSQSDIGQKKVLLAQKKLQEQNPFIEINAYDLRLNATNIVEVATKYDIILDGSDNFDTKYLLNDTCVSLNKTLVFGAIHQYEGQATVFNAPLKNGLRSHNYRAIFPNSDENAVYNCAVAGVISPLPGIIACIQANETIKLITGIGESLAGKFYQINVLTMESRILKLNA
jgi:sulfur-carrier protein adenylyltransferase/sulfurtransferase